MRTFAEVKAGLLADPKVRAAMDALELALARGWRQVVRDKRAWRAKERAAHVKPASTKVAFYSPKVDTVPAVKPRGRGK